MYNDTMCCKKINRVLTKQTKHAMLLPTLEISKTFYMAKVYVADLIYKIYYINVKKIVIKQLY